MLPEIIHKQPQKPYPIRFSDLTVGEFFSNHDNGGLMQKTSEKDAMIFEPVTAPGAIPSFKLCVWSPEVQVFRKRVRIEVLP